MQENQNPRTRLIPLSLAGVGVRHRRLVDWIGPIARLRVIPLRLLPAAFAPSVPEIALKRLSGRVYS